MTDTVPIRDHRRAGDPAPRCGIALGLAVAVEWWGWREAAKRAAVPDQEMARAIREGLVVSDCTEVWVMDRRSTRSVKRSIWWVRADSARDYGRRLRERAKAVGDDEPGEERCVLYGLLTASDVAELDRRRAKRQGRLFSV